MKTSRSVAKTMAAVNKNVSTRQVHISVAVEEDTLSMLRTTRHVKVWVDTLATPL